MKIAYDFEFLDDGEIIDPISAGFVAEDGRTLYWINNQFNWNRDSEQMSWLTLNVLPYLHDVPEGVTIIQTSKALFKSSLRMFLSRGGEPELWGYYSSYDHVALAQIFGPMIAWPFKKTMHTNDIKQMCDLFNIKKSELPREDSSVVHNAYHDALWTMNAYRIIAAKIKDLT